MLILNFLFKNISCMPFWKYLGIMKYFQIDYMVFQIIRRKEQETVAFLLYYFVTILRYLII